MWWWSVGGVVGLLDGGATAAAVGDLVAVGAGLFADLGEPGAPPTENVRDVDGEVTQAKDGGRFRAMTWAQGGVTRSVDNSLGGILSPAPTAQGPAQLAFGGHSASCPP